MDATGTVVAHYEYAPFGSLTAATGLMADAFAFRFSTKYLDSETALWYYGYRYYDAANGRWLSRDPIGERGGSNLLAFCSNTPDRSVDLLGLYPNGLTANDIIVTVVPGSDFVLVERKRPVPVAGGGTELRWVTEAVRVEQLAMGGTEADFFGIPGPFTPNPSPGGTVPVGGGTGGLFEAICNTVAQKLSDRAAEKAARESAAKKAKESQSPKTEAGGGGSEPPTPPMSYVSGEDEDGGKPRSFEDIVREPKSLYGMTEKEAAHILGEGWTRGEYGKTGTGWKFTKGDRMVFFHQGGRHVGAYYGFSSGTTGKVKTVIPQ